MNGSGKSLLLHTSDADVATLKPPLQAQGHGGHVLWERFLDVMEAV
jgi:hypothetical protein